MGAAVQIFQNCVAFLVGSISRLKRTPIWNWIFSSKFSCFPAIETKIYGMLHHIETSQLIWTIQLSLWKVTYENATNIREKFFLNKNKDGKVLFLIFVRVWKTWQFTCELFTTKNYSLNFLRFEYLCIILKEVPAEIMKRKIFSETFENFIKLSIASDITSHRIVNFFQRG